MRATVIIVSLVLSCPAAAPWPRVAAAATDSIETLAEQLKTGLRAQRPRETEFCDAVADLVRVGRLPAGLVDATYVWAIRRGRKYPFPAFEHALRIKADRLGVRLP